MFHVNKNPGDKISNNFNSRQPSRPQASISGALLAIRRMAYQLQDVTTSPVVVRDVSALAPKSSAGKPRPRPLSPCCSAAAGSSAAQLHEIQAQSLDADRVPQPTSRRARSDHAHRDRLATFPPGLASAPLRSLLRLLQLRRKWSRVT